jgi:hypothetical protein
MFSVGGGFVGSEYGDGSDGMDGMCFHFRSFAMFQNCFSKTPHSEQDNPVATGIDEKITDLQWRKQRLKR